MTELGCKTDSDAGRLQIQKTVLLASGRELVEAVVEARSWLAEGASRDKATRPQFGPGRRFGPT